MKRKTKMLGAVLILSIIGISAFSDWDPGDGHKMHYPQMPKVDGGWDVMSQYYVTLADDWMCSESGYVNDIHTWISFKEDQEFAFNTIHLAIYADDPVGDSGIPGEDPNNDYSKPLGVPLTDALWHPDPVAGDWSMRLWDQGDQGWYDPRLEPGAAISNDHLNVYQLNFLFDDSEAFWQEQGTVYWLEFSIQDPHEGLVTERVGWKQSDTNFLDAAVWRDPSNDWKKLLDPEGNDIDLAFVITPEPTTISMVTLVSGLALFIRRRFIG